MKNNQSNPKMMLYNLVRKSVLFCMKNQKCVGMVRTVNVICVMCMFKHFLEVNEEVSDNEDNEHDGDNDDAIEDESEKTFQTHPSQKHILWKPSSLWFSYLVEINF